MHLPANNFVHPNIGKETGIDRRVCVCNGRPQFTTHKVPVEESVPPDTGSSNRNSGLVLATKFRPEIHGQIDVRSVGKGGRETRIEATIVDIASIDFYDHSVH